MSINGPFDLEPWRARLEAGVSVLRSVGLAADLATVKAGSRSTPQAFVVPVSDAPGARSAPGTSIRSQSVVTTIAVVIAVSNQRSSATGGQASMDLQSVRRAIMDSLIGWTPPGGDLAISYAGGRALDYSDATAWWTDRYTSAYFVRKEFS